MFLLPKKFSKMLHDLYTSYGVKTDGSLKWTLRDNLSELGMHSLDEILERKFRSKYNREMNKRITKLEELLGVKTEHQKEVTYLVKGNKRVEL